MRFSAVALGGLNGTSVANIRRMHKYIALLIAVASIGFTQPASAGLTAGQFRLARAKLTPKVRAQRAFERWLRANPEMAAHHKELKTARRNRMIGWTLVGSAVGALAGAHAAADSAMIVTSMAAGLWALVQSARTDYFSKTSHPITATLVEGGRRGIPGTRQVAQRMHDSHFSSQESLNDAHHLADEKDRQAAAEAQRIKDDAALMRIQQTKEQRELNYMFPR